MEPKQTTKITINGQVYERIEDVPEQYRELIKAQMKLAMEKAAGLPDVNIAVKKTIRLGAPGSDGDPSVTVSGSPFKFLQVALPFALLAFLVYMIVFHWR